ncbi:hypothetical protein BCV71DRAFT_237148 [Rhizopus microsporus]|uniref:Uncharacterized protein n=1 Tax=Rhizopus microsporus TaxID=58291 RepID=A0A1X0RUZ5_RHIZD|nr:hypothetical protein BCV71DRAFT_237148 [Rhizopus microsporus]
MAHYPPPDCISVVVTVKNGRDYVHCVCSSLLNYQHMTFFSWFYYKRKGTLFNFCLSVAHVVPRGNYIAVGLDEVIDTTVCTPLNQANVTSLRVFTLEHMFLETFYRKLPAAMPPTVYPLKLCRQYSAGNAHGRNLVWNRDVNAALNIRSIPVDYVDSNYNIRSRHAAFSRVLEPALSSH